jgi:hypothetical protein
MQRKMLFLCILLYVVCFTAIKPVYASETVPWKVDKVGTFDVPAAWETADIWEVGKLLNTLSGAKGDLKNEIIPANIPGVKTNPFVQLEEGNVRLFYVTMNDGKAYHTAALIFYKDDQPMGANEQKYFGNKVSKEQRKEIESTIKLLHDGFAPALPNDSETNLGIRLLELTPVDYLKIGEKQGYAEGIRLVGNFHGIILPFYAKGYVFDTHGYLTAAVLVTSDSERGYWDPLFRKVIRSLH